MVTKISPRTKTARQAAFLAALACRGQIVKAAAAVPISRGTHYRWCREDSDYKARFEVAVQLAARRLG
jgi:transcriptional regulator of acetoin/glycerol metabolism